MNQAAEQVDQFDLLGQLAQRRDFLLLGEQRELQGSGGHGEY
ncbi:TPA: hypothetical protein ACK3PA_001543 [Burkholderia cenocepacia]